MSIEESTLAELVERLRAEQRRLWLAGERIATEVYFARHPQLVDDMNCALKMVYNEVLLHEAEGDGPRLEEYVRRFPRYADQLAPLFEVHRALESDHLLAAVAGVTQSRDTVSPDEAERTGPSPFVAGHEIIGELGRGGMGVVYKARHVGLDRVVALKMILGGDLADPSRLARFRAEAKAVAHLQHPNIVQVYDVGEQDGRPYFSLEFIDGGSLADALNGTPQPARLAAELVRTLAGAMHAAHEKGIIHRDLKPANILLQKDEGGRMKDEKKALSDSSFILHPSSFLPKITDFGLAKHLEAGDGQTGSGMIVGTPSYMAPEQADGRVREIGPAVDVYALGAILYELLVGRPPFKAPTPLDTLRQVLSDEPVPISRFHRKVPRDLDTICVKCLEKEPRKRYASAQDLADDLSRFLADRPIQARRAGALERLWRWCRRNPTVAGLMTSVAALVLIVAIGSSIATVRLGRELARVERAEEATLQEKEATTARLWDSYLQQARASRLTNEAGRRFHGLEVLAAAARIRPDLKLRNEAVAFMALADLRPDREPAGELPPQGGVAFDAGLEHYVRSDAAGNLSFRRVADDREIISLIGPGCSAQVMRFSPDGRFLAAKHFLGYRDMAREYQVWDWRRGKRVVHQPSDNLGAALDFSPDSRRVVLGGRQDGSVRFYDLPSGDLVQCLQLGYPPDELAFHPGGNQLAASSTVLRIHDQEGKVLAMFQPPCRLLRGLAWRGDGRLLALAGSDGDIYIWDAEARRQRSVLRGHQAQVLDVAFSPDGEMLASTGWDGTTRLWEAASGRHLVWARGVFGRFSADGQHLSYRRGSDVGTWEVTAGRECRRLQGLRPSSGGALSLQFGLDGQLLVMCSGAEVGIWDAATGTQVADLPLVRNPTALFQPDGGTLITCGAQGLYRWRLSPAEAGARDGLQIGPPEVVPMPEGCRPERACLDQKGRRLAIVDRSEDRLVIIDSEKPAAAMVLNGCHPGMVYISMSPEGEWVATGTSKGADVKIWDVGRREVVASLPGETATVCFSPDGRWLVTGVNNAYRFYHTGSWQPAHVIRTEHMEWGGGVAAFSADGKMVAVAHSVSSVKLACTETGEEIVTLMVTEPQMIESLCFSPDGTKLAVANADGVIHLWDLGQIRRQLTVLDLDWGSRPYPPAQGPGPGAPVPTQPCHIDVRLNGPLYHARARRRWANKEYGLAIADYRMALEVDPGRVEACNDLAWAYVTAPVELRDPKRALTLVRQSLEKEPNNSRYLNTLGLVHYRLANYPAAVAALKPNIENDGTRDVAFDWIVLALSHHGLGQTSRACDCYFRAIQPHLLARLTPEQKAEWSGLRAEADALLGKK